MLSTLVWRCAQSARECTLYVHCTHGPFVSRYAFLCDMPDGLYYMTFYYYCSSCKIRIVNKKKKISSRSVVFPQNTYEWAAIASSSFFFFIIFLSFIRFCLFYVCSVAFIATADRRRARLYFGLLRYGIVLLAILVVFVLARHTKYKSYVRGCGVL